MLKKYVAAVVGITVAMGSLVMSAPQARADGYVVGQPQVLALGGGRSFAVNRMGVCGLGGLTESVNWVMVRR